MQQTLPTTRCARQAGAAALVLSCAWAFAGDLHAQAADVMPTPSRVREILERPAAGPAIWALPSPDLAPIDFEHGLPEFPWS